MIISPVFVSFLGNLSHDSLIVKEHQLHGIVNILARDYGISKHCNRFGKTVSFMFVLFQIRNFLCSH